MVSDLGWHEKQMINPGVWPKVIKTIKRNVFSQKFEPEVFFLTKIIPNDAVCLDVGASYGRYAYYLSKYVCPKGEVFAFEPGSDSFAILSTIKFFHRLNNVHLIKKALLDQTQILNLVVPIKHNNKAHKGLSLAYVSHENVSNSHLEQIQTITLDEFCDGLRPSRIDFIKCDVEGAEALVLRGGAGTIKKFLPNMLFEVNHDFFKDKFPESLGIIDAILREHNYNVYLFSKDRPQAVRELKANGNYFFIPPSRIGQFEKVCQI